MITSSGSRNDVTRSVEGIPNHLSSMSISSYQIIFEKKQRGINWPNIQNLLS